MSKKLEVGAQRVESEVAIDDAWQKGPLQERPDQSKRLSRALFVIAARSKMSAQQQFPITGRGHRGSKEEKSCVSRPRYIASSSTTSTIDRIVPNDNYGAAELHVPILLKALPRDAKRHAFRSRASSYLSVLKLYSSTCPSSRHAKVLKCSNARLNTLQRSGASEPPPTVQFRLPPPALQLFSWARKVQTNICQCAPPNV